MSSPAPEGRCARACVVTALAALLLWPEAQATPAEGYAFTLTPLLQYRAQWLLLRGIERSEPNTATATGRAPAMKVQRDWWVVVDRAGRVRCSTKAIDPPTEVAPAMAPAVTAHLRARCPALTGVAAFRSGAAWVAAAATETGSASWSGGQLCIRERCVDADRPQRTLFDKASSRAGAVEPVARAPARCVADRWLVVTNGDAGNGQLAGARFVGVPPPLRTDIVGYEFEMVDGVALLPHGMRCVP